MGGAGGEHEQFFHAPCLGDRDHVVEDGFAVAAVAAVCFHREAGQFGGSFVGKWIECGATDDAVIVFQHHETVNLLFQ